jgi:biotin operon repressor
MLDSGWVCLHRKIIEWEWFDDPIMVKFFIYCVSKANFEDKTYRGIALKRGEFITSIPSLCADLKLTEQVVRTCIKRLKLTGELTDKTTNKYRIISLCNYSKYQDKQDNDNRQTNSLANRQLTDKQQTTNRQLTADNNITIKQLNNNNHAQEQKNNWRNSWKNEKPTNWHLDDKRDDFYTPEARALRLQGNIRFYKHFEFDDSKLKPQGITPIVTWLKTYDLPETECDEYGDATAEFHEILLKMQPKTITSWSYFQDIFYDCMDKYFDRKEVQNVL